MNRLIPCRFGSPSGFIAFAQIEFSIRNSHERQMIGLIEHIPAGFPVFLQPFCLEQTKPCQPVILRSRTAEPGQRLLCILFCTCPIEKAGRPFRHSQHITALCHAGKSIRHGHVIFRFPCAGKSAHFHGAAGAAAEDLFLAVFFPFGKGSHGPEQCPGIASVYPLGQKNLAKGIQSPAIILLTFLHKGRHGFFELVMNKLCFGFHRLTSLVTKTNQIRRSASSRLIFSLEFSTSLASTTPAAAACSRRTRPLLLSTFMPMPCIFMRPRI